MSFIDFLQLQKGRMVAEGVKYLIFDFFSETTSLIWKKKLDGKQVPKVFSHVCLFLAYQSVFYKFNFSFFQRKYMYIQAFSVCTTIIF